MTTLIDIAIRPLDRLEEFASCVELQRAVWGWPDVDLVPVRVLVLLQQVGGLVLGAYDGDTLVGLVNCVPGVRDGRAYWHSHMLGVRASHQNRGIGTSLKLAQREHARRQGVAYLQWVFDPLEAKNAYVNIAKLGAVVRRYSPNHYGAGSSRFAAGFESDRIVAEWPVTPDRVRYGAAARVVAIPADIQAIRHADPDEARRLQRAVREQFQRNLADGFVVVWCDRHRERSEYVFRQPIAEAAASARPWR